jgi:peptidoglycan L-alanyl-D-glutamate endopeptidase CwlK
MPQFSSQSLERLRTCHTSLQKVFNEVIKHVDCTILCGYRSEAEQQEAFRTGKSKVVFPNSKHNTNPSLAIDACPYPVDWNDTKRFYYFAGLVMGIAKNLGIELRYGGDWDSDFDLKDQNFFDLPHFEMVIGVAKSAGDSNG